MNSKTPTPKEPAISLRYILIFLAVATGTAGAIIAIWAYSKFASPDTLGINVADIRDKPSAEEIIALVKHVSQIAILPGGEIPDVLVISDLTQMRANPFFADASLHDYIIIYKKAGKVIIYNPKSNKIVNEGPYVAAPKEATSSAAPAGPSSEPAPTPTPEPSPTASPTPES